LKGA